MRIPPRPVKPADSIYQSRDITGLNKWARSSRVVSVVMLILGWLTIPTEVLLRREFGQRWFTVTNYIAGFVVLMIFGVVFAIGKVTTDFMQQFDYIFSSVNDEPYGSFYYQLSDYVLEFVVDAYVILGAYHLFRIWWRNRTNNPLHSFDNGRSILHWGGFWGHLVNACAFPILFLLKYTLPRGRRVGMKTPLLVNDTLTFTETVVEPLFLFTFGTLMHGVPRIWLILSSIATGIYANWRRSERLNKILDLQDSIIEAKAMLQLKEETILPTTQNILMQQNALEIETHPEVASYVKCQHPDLMSIIEELNSDGSHLNYKYETK